MQAIIKNTELYRPNEHGLFVCRGRLVCGHVGSFWKIMEMDELRGKLRPVIVSDTEEVGAEDTILVDLKIHKLTGLDDLHGYEVHNENIPFYKIIALPEHFSDDQIKAIASGELKNNDEVMVECEHAPAWEPTKNWEQTGCANPGIMTGLYQVRFDDNKAVFHPVIANEIKEAKLRKLAKVLDDYGLRKHTCMNGFGYSLVERDIVDALTDGMYERKDMHNAYCAGSNFDQYDNTEYYMFTEWMNKYKDKS